MYIRGRGEGEGGKGEGGEGGEGEGRGERGGLKFQGTLCGWVWVCMCVRVCTVCVERLCKLYPSSPLSPSSLPPPSSLLPPPSSLLPPPSSLLPPPSSLLPPPSSLLPPPSSLLPPPSSPTAAFNLWWPRWIRWGDNQSSGRQRGWVPITSLHLYWRWFITLLQLPLIVWFPSFCITASSGYKGWSLQYAAQYLRLWLGSQFVTA